MSHQFLKDICSQVIEKERRKSQSVRQKCKPQQTHSKRINRPRKILRG
jgi:hypothetical protein